MKGQRFLLAFALCGAWLSADAATKPLSEEDVRWLNRITYGIDGATVAQYQTLGRKAFLEMQLRGSETGMPAAVSETLAHLDLLNLPLSQSLQDVDLANKHINTLPSEDEKQQARKQLNDQASITVYETNKRHLLRALYSPAQLKEQMVWFWDNHFSVFQGKANLRWSVADYEERAIRPHAMGNFRDLLLATLKHPAMLVYLDNAQSAGGKINENYARELLELHTLGVNGGYSQQDVQELARILTGVGIDTQPTAPKLKPEWQALYLRDGAFEFNPARHDFGDKQFLGQTITGQGWGEVEQAIDLIVKQPATAHFISNKLALYFVSDDPPPALVERLAKTFQHSNGDISAVLRTMFNSKEFTASLGSKFKDPMHYVVSAMRLAYNGKTVTNLKPVNNWLNALGEPLYGRLTPDGYGLRQRDWASSGQMSKRFEIARAIGGGSAGLFDSEDGSPPVAFGFPMLSNKLFYETVDNVMSVPVKLALDKAASQAEWNAYLLASPDFMYR
ncbi:MAG TPA: DUF1800 domain-containing protein [Burkholderiaceae bacterium]|jgi:uncharacterized protein (DUF1800 family)|nr:DUF1800 domain-containing protein [Burkholderiaceae bacterium]